MPFKFVIFPMLVASVFLLVGCGNTIEGVDRDVTEWGKTLDEMF